MSDVAAPERPTRWHLAVLLGILVLAVLRGSLWAGIMVLPSPVDEVAHAAYVDHIATGSGIPVVGEDRVPGWLLEVSKASGTDAARSVPAPADPTLDVWGALAEQYEAHQGPVAYLLLTPAALAVDAEARPLAALMALRLLAVMLAATAVLAAWALARELAPSRPGSWLAAAGLLAFVQGLNADTASVTNDGVMTALAGAVLVLIARAARTGFDLRNALVTGVLLAAAVLSKPNAMTVVVLGGLAVGASALRGRITWLRAAAWSAVVGAVSAVPVIAWLAWNMATYRSGTAADAVYEMIIEPLQPPMPFGRTALRLHTEANLAGLWPGQATGASSTAVSTYATWWWAATIAALGIALLARRAARDSETRSTAAGALWCVAALPAAQAVHVAIIYTVVEGATVTGGRLLYPALVPLATGLALAASLLGRRHAALAVTVIALGAVALEAPILQQAVGRYSSPPTSETGELAWIQDRADSPTDVRRIAVEPPCPVVAVGIWLVEGPGPVQVGVTVEGAAPTTAALEREQRRSPPWPATYQLPEPATEPFVIDLPSQAIAGRTHEAEGGPVAFVDAPGTPATRLWCAAGTAPDPTGIWFASTYGWRDVAGLGPTGLRVLVTTGSLLAGLAALGLGAAVSSSSAATSGRQPSSSARNLPV